jgi:hypothetical protein
VRGLRSVNTTKGWDIKPTILIIETKSLKVINILTSIHRKETTEFVNITEVSVSQYHK